MNRPLLNKKAYAFLFSNGRYRAEYCLNLPNWYSSPMKLLVAAIAFGVTIGGLFLFENYKTTPKEEDYAQIVQGLSNQNQTTTPSTKKSSKSSPLTLLTTNSATASPTPPSSTAPSTIPKPTYTIYPTPTPLKNPTSSPQTTSSPTPASTTVPTPSPYPSISSQPSPTATEGTATPSPIPEPTGQITIVSLTSPVKQNTTAQLNIQTTPTTQCSIKVTLPSGGQSSAGGLEAKTADNSGTITWSWKINWNTTPGTANIDIGCSKDGQSFSKSLQMTIIER